MINFYLPGKDQSNAPGFILDPYLNRDLLESLRIGEYKDHEDLVCAQELLDVIWTELSKFDEMSPSLSIPNSDIQLAQKTLVYVLDRLDISLEFPWRNFDDFISLSYNSMGDFRNEELQKLLGPVSRELDKREMKQIRRRLALPITDEVETPSWEIVNMRVNDLRKRFGVAEKNTDYHAIGNHVVLLYEEVGKVLFKKTLSLTDGVTPNKSLEDKSKSKNRIEWYLETAFPQRMDRYSSLVKLADEAIKNVNSVKHDNGQANKLAYYCDCTILLITVLQRITREKELSLSQEEKKKHER